MRPQATPTTESTLRRQMEARHRAELDELFRQVDLIHQQHAARVYRTTAVAVTLALLTLTAALGIIATLTA